MTILPGALSQRWADCTCEDYPCCGHFDYEPGEPEFCDRCMSYHPSGSCPEDDYDPADDEYDDEEDDQ